MAFLSLLGQVSFPVNSKPEMSRLLFVQWTRKDFFDKVTSIKIYKTLL